MKYYKISTLHSYSYLEFVLHHIACRSTCSYIIFNGTLFDDINLNKKNSIKKFIFKFKYNKKTCVIIKAKITKNHNHLSGISSNHHPTNALVINKLKTQTSLP